jgi:hypothetical protein
VKVIPKRLIAVNALRRSQHLQRELHVALQHQCTCRPSKSRTTRAVFSAWRASWVTITTVAASG